MTNSEIEVTLIQNFGLDDTIKYCEMTAYIYSVLHDEITKEEYDECDYGYDARWWRDKAVELKQIAKYKR
jgi:hypothetical protein